jgi:hypothetical protein
MPLSGLSTVFEIATTSLSLMTSCLCVLTINASHSSHSEAVFELFDDKPLIKMLNVLFWSKNSSCADLDQNVFDFVFDNAVVDTDFFDKSQSKYCAFSFHKLVRLFDAKVN